MAAIRVWAVTCELCAGVEQTDGDLTVDELGAWLTVAGWYVPRYGGTFHRTCYNRMRAVLGESPLPEPNPVADLFETVQRVKNIVWQTFGIEPGIPQRALPPAGCIGAGCPRGPVGCFLCDDDDRT